MKKLFTLLLGASALLPLGAQAEQMGSLVTPPENGTEILYCRNSLDLMFTSMGTISNFEYYGIAQNIIEDGDDVYMVNPVGSFFYDTIYIKGKKTATGYHFPMPQEVYRMDNEGQVNTFIADIYYLDPATYEYEQDNLDDHSFDLDLQPDGSYKFDYLGYHPVSTWLGTTYYTELILGIGEKETGDWIGFGECTCRLIPFDSTPLEVPADMETKEYQFIYDVNGHNVKIGRDGNDLYIGGLNDQDSDRWVKGTVDGNKATIPSGQYIGVADGVTLFLCGATNIGSDDAPVPENNPAVILFYDEKNDTWTAEDMVLFCNSPELDEATGIFVSCEFRPVPKSLNPKPAKPEIVPNSFSNYDKAMEWGYVRVQLTTLNVDGDVLPADRISYAFYIDDELYWLDPADYTRLEEEMSWIPYNFTDNWDILSYTRGLRTFYFFAEVEKTFAVESRYKDEEGNYHYSGRYTITASGEHLGVNSIGADNGAVVSEQVFDLTGRRAANNQKGMTIKLQKMSDGSVKALKQHNIR